MMFKTTIKSLLAHKLRLAATALAVTLGVAFIAGTLVLTDTIGRTFDDLFASIYQNTDAVVRQEAAFDAGLEGGGEQRGPVEASLVDTVAAVPGVAVAQGDVTGYARLVGKDGEPLGTAAGGAPTLGGNWIESEELNVFTLVEGRAPRAPDEVVIDKGSAEKGDFAVGDTATVLVHGGPRQVQVVGIAKMGEADSMGGATWVGFTTPVAQEVVGEPGKFSSISVAAEEGVSEEEVVRRISRVVPDGIEVLTGTEITEQTQSDIREFMSIFNTFMLVFAVVALLVGSFMIFNTFSITVAQRTRENALLRAIGATKRQVLGSVLLEAVVVGLLASVVGLVAGIAVASGLKAMLAAFGIDIPAGGVVFTGRTVVVALVAGLLVTVVAAVSPARKAGKVPPVAAMRDIVVGSAGYGSRLRIVVGGVILALGVAALVQGLWVGGDNALAVVGVGVLLVFFGVSVLGRTIALPLSRVLGAPLPRLRGMAGTLAHENAMRNPKRTAATASALMIGVGLVGFITILAASTKASIDDSIDASFTGDIVVESGAMGFGGLDPSLARELNQLPEVDSATGVRIGAAIVAGNTVPDLLAADPATAFDIIDVDPLQGSPADLDVDGIAVFEEKANEEGLEVGDRVPVTFRDTGEKTLTVAMIYGEDNLVGNYLIGMDAYEANFAQPYDARIYVKKADDVSADAALAAVGQVTDAYPGAEVLDQTEYKAEQASEVDRILGLVYALLALAIVIALLGIGNTLALSILERTRELGLLRAVGMTRSQLRATVRWESVIIALQGTLLGLIIGIFFGWALVVSLRDEGLTVFRVPWLNLAVVVVLGGLAGILAAVLPARRAANIDVLRAVVTE